LQASYKGQECVIGLGSQVSYEDKECAIGTGQASAKDKECEFGSLLQVSYKDKELAIDNGSQVSYEDKECAIGSKAIDRVDKGVLHIAAHCADQACEGGNATCEFGGEVNYKDKERASYKDQECEIGMQVSYMPEECEIGNPIEAGECCTAAGQADHECEVGTKTRAASGEASYAYKECKIGEQASYKDEECEIDDSQASYKDQSAECEDGTARIDTPAEGELGEAAREFGKKQVRFQVDQRVVGDQLSQASEECEFGTANYKDKERGINPISHAASSCAVDAIGNEASHGGQVSYQDQECATGGQEGEIGSQASNFPTECESGNQSEEEPWRVVATPRKPRRGGLHLGLGKDRGKGIGQDRDNGTGKDKGHGKGLRGKHKSQGLSGKDKSKGSLYRSSRDMAWLVVEGTLTRAAFLPDDWDILLSDLRARGEHELSRLLGGS
jgi:hypothetical protein